MLRISCRKLLFPLLLLLSGCFGGGHYAPVIERQGPVKTFPSSHIVSAGETLYSIAWLYKMDSAALARANKINSPYTIYPGQRLSLTPLPDATIKPLRSLPNHSATSGIARDRPVLNPPTSPATPTTASSPLGIDKTRYPFRWQWPAKGRMTRSYTASSAVHKGIDIEGKLGEPVHAANSGKVVYAGSGLVGYGKLLIIKHDAHYLSAYGHNSKLLVGEGELVKVGQVIAEFGDSGTDKVKLHFEIRRHGEPVNPLGLLPQG
jgi:lipoprotein NlpD